MKNFLTGDGFILVPRVTTTERNALTATNGMLVYDTTLNKFYFYENSAWVNVGGGNSYSRTVINGNTTAANDTDYTLVSSSTITDPTPEEGKGYTVLIRNGTATIGGTGYSTVGQLLFRVYHSGAWVTYQLTTQAQLNDKADKSNTTLSSYLEIPEQSKPATPTNAIRFFIDSSNRLSWIGENGYVRTFDGTANTADRVYTLPNTAGTLPVGTGTTNEITYWSGTNTLSTLSTATYPSLTELSYVKGVTSAIQTQLDNRSVLLSSATASNSATIDFTLTSGYKSFDIRVISLVPSTDNVGMWVRVSTDGGNTFASGASDYFYQRNFQNDATLLPVLSAGDSKIITLGTGIGNGTGRYFNALITIYDPANASSHKNISFALYTFRSDSIYSIAYGNGVYKYNTAINAIRILMSSGNITSGTFELWGYK